LLVAGNIYNHFQFSFFSFRVFLFGNISDQRSAAGRRLLVLATNRNSGMLRLNASRHDDDDVSIRWTGICIFYFSLFHGSNSCDVSFI